MMLRPDFNILEPEGMADRMRLATEATSALFYVQVGHRTLGTVFATENLQEKIIADRPGPEEFNLVLPGPGELRVGRFRLGRMTMFVGSSLGPVRQVLKGYLQAAAVVMAAVVAVSCAVGFGLSRIALRPVRAIQQTAEHIGSDNLSERIPVGPVDDEISNLARLLNRTFDRLELAFNQVRRFAGEASHELKTPLALARMHAEKLMADGGMAAGQEEAVQNILEELARLEKIIEELLLLSRAEAQAIPLELRVLEPAAFMRAFAQDARALGEYRGVRVEEHCEGTGTVELDPKWIRQVLLNVVTNALRVTPPNGLITIGSRIDATQWAIAVQDEGPGVPDEQLERIFERFVRLNPREEDKGSGLGLAISRSIVTLHRGTIRAERASPGPGLRITIALPVTDVAPTRVRVDGQTHARAAHMAG
jgi:two-component system heavy metal sensor histidine kinase CusS